MVHGPAVGHGGIRDDSPASSHGRWHGGAAAGASSTHNCRCRLRCAGGAEARITSGTSFHESMEPMRSMLWTSPPLPMTIGARLPPTRSYLFGAGGWGKEIRRPMLEWDSTHHRVKGTHPRLSSPWFGRFLQAGSADVDQGVERCPSGTPLGSVYRDRDRDRNQTKSKPEVEASWRDSAPSRRKLCSRHPAG